MVAKELLDLLVISSQRTNSAKYIPWWEGNHEEAIYRYNIFEEKEVKEAEICLADCGKETLLTAGGYYGLTLFHLLIWHNFYSAVEKMLCDGRIEEEVNMPDTKGNGLTPFLLACFRGNLAMAKLLLAHGADASACDKRGMNAYHFLAYPKFEGLADSTTAREKSVEQRAEIARLLTIDVNQKDAEGFTPLVRILSNSYNSDYTWSLPEVFLEKGAETEYVDENGNTLLMMAARNNHMTAALALMNRCREMVHVANKSGMTPMQNAIDFCNDVLRVALADHGAVSADKKRMDIETLSEITEHAYSRIESDNRDGVSLALYMTEKLVKQIDVDDDEELSCLKDVLHRALRIDRSYHILDACMDAGFDFTAPIHHYGEISCLRDECLSEGAGVMKKLMALGVDMEEAVIGGRTPVNIVASMDGEEDVFFAEAAAVCSKESMEQIDNKGKAAIHYAAGKGHIAMLKVMIEKGVDVNLTEDEPAEAGITSLHEACRLGCVDAVRLLMGAGADDTMQNLAGETPAHFVLTKKKYGNDVDSAQRAEILKELKNLDIAREDGRTPLMLLADLRDTKELLSLLIDRGVDVNHTDNEGQTLMMLDADKDTIKELLRAGADIHAADNEGNTVLYYVLKNGDVETARYLIKKGADYNHLNNQGETPVQIAVEEGYDTVLELMTDIK